MADLRYIPGIVAAVAVMVAVFGFVWGGLVLLVVSQPAVLLVLPALFLLAQGYIWVDKTTHPNRRVK